MKIPLLTDLGHGRPGVEPPRGCGSPSAASVDHWYFLTGVDAYLPARSSALVVVGDSITDGRDSTTNANNRWPELRCTEPCFRC